MDHPGDQTAAGSRRGTGQDPLASAGERHRQRERLLEAAHRARRIPHHRSMVLHWVGGWLRGQREPAPVVLPEVVPGQVAISFGGHATALVRYAGLTIACDPMLGYWVRGIKRVAPPGLTVEAMREVDLILISHGHTDHLHRETLSRLPRSATIVVPPGTAQQASGLGFARVVELEVGQSFQNRGVDITTAPVCHGDGGDVRGLSYVLRGDGPSVYFCGDSGYFPGFAEIGARMQPDIALLPIGGYYPLSFRVRHMSPLDALYALEDLRARIMIPIHHGAFPLSYERLDEPLRWLAELVDERRLRDFVIALAPGESRVFVPPRSRRERAASAPGIQGDPGESVPPVAGDQRAAMEALLAGTARGSAPWALAMQRARTLPEVPALGLPDRLPPAVAEAVPEAFIEAFPKTCTDARIDAFIDARIDAFIDARVGAFGDEQAIDVALDEALGAV
jgi:L-ascorbate metabolism protein UlaG (beta-lactamase superfamily)